MIGTYCGYEIHEDQPVPQKAVQLSINRDRHTRLKSFTGWVSPKGIAYPAVKGELWKVCYGMGLYKGIRTPEGDLPDAPSGCDIGDVLYPLGWRRFIYGNHHWTGCIHDKKNVRPAKLCHYKAIMRLTRRKDE